MEMPYKTSDGINQNLPLLMLLLLQRTQSS